ncbi:hypothetical protein Tco_0459516, partial [Tanacetum coccineum]
SRLNNKGVYTKFKIFNMTDYEKGRITWDDDDVLDVLSLDSSIDERKSLEVMCTSKRYDWPNCSSEEGGCGGGVGELSHGGDGGVGESSRGGGDVCESSGGGSAYSRQERVSLLVGSPGASTTPSYSPGPSTTLTYSPRPSTPSSYSLRPSRNAECSNCKLLSENKVLEAKLEMYMRPENHTLDSAALLHELYNDMRKFSLE